MDVVYKSVACL